ncbi:hypothetical protein [Spirillospora sp. NPDC029432]|uniref:hypothetical protein n=1 Tax=Spirillospora sp. NPDC029432 TaxID=3154599 RepID=UPI003453D221
MPAVLTTASRLRCMHGGTLTAAPSQASLTVDGSPALLVTDLMAATVAGCTNNDPSKGFTPCLKVTAVTAGAATKLTVRGTPVALATARGTTNATPPAPVMWQVSDAGQSKLSAV